MVLIQSSTWRPKYLLVVHNAAPTTEGTSGHIISSVLVAAALAGLCVQLAVLPLWLLPADPAWVWLLVPMALLTTPFWSLIHEAIHGVLLRERVWNDRFGRTLAIGYGAPFVLLKAAHLLHHRYSRTRRERTEIYDPATSSWAAAAPGYYLRLLGGVYLAEVASVLLVASPRRLWRYLARRLDSPDTFAGMLLEGISRRHLREFRADGVAVILVYAAAGFAYGRHVWILAAALAARALLISVADNAYHYGTRLDARLEAMNLRLPKPLETFILAFNLHSVHHRHPGLPWYELRSAFAADDDQFHLGWFTAAARQLRGPISAEAHDLLQERTG
jgi:fatty acid desaturase